MNKDVLEEVIRVEILKKIRSIFKQMQVMRHSCYIDSLVRIDDEIYDCDKCVLLDTIHTVRIMCPLIMKRETRILK